MKKTPMYKYLGTNGILETPIHLEGIYSVKYLILEADAGKILTNGTEKRHSVKILADEADAWTEIDLAENK